jgi:hypothetical protein
VAAVDEKAAILESARTLLQDLRKCAA